MKRFFCKWKGIILANPVKGIKLVFQSIVQLYRDNVGVKEVTKRYGKLHEDKTFYVIRRPSPGGGLFSNFQWVLGHIIYAVEKNYIPVVDMQNYKTYYNEKEPINGTENSWEYYFKQPTSFTLKDAYKAQNTILAEMKFPSSIIPVFFETNEQIDFFSTWIAKYMQFNEITKKYIEESKQELFNGKKNILGVLYRGTDYLGLKPRNHPILPSIDDCIAKANECLDKWEVDRIFLVTEDMDAVKIFEKTFGEKLIITNSKRIENYKKEMGGIPSLSFERQHDNYLKGLEYIRDVYLLSLCDSIIAPRVNGSTIALALNNNKYKHKYIFSLGQY